jgi:hypothetical protein
MKLFHKSAKKSYLTSELGHCFKAGGASARGLTDLFFEKASAARLSRS